MIISIVPYDLAGNRTGFTLEKDDETVHNITYTYDNLNRLSTVSENENVEATYTYDTNGNRASLTLGNGVVTTYSYNLANWVTNLVNKNSNGNVLSSYSYEYYASGNQKSKTDNDGVVTSYVYDDLGRLTSESESGGVTLNYTYDAARNRTKLTASGTESYTVDYSYNAVNQLTSEVKTSDGATETTSYTYDNNGNMLSKTSPEGTQANTYNNLNQLISSITAGVTSSYIYFPSGIRFSKTVGNATTEYLLDGGNVIGEVQNGDVTAKYLYGANLISRKTDSNPEYYIFNAHGDVVNLIDHAQVETMRPGYDYDAFGNEKNPSATDTNPFRYCGEYYDTETGTYYLRARYYDPSIGRFTQQDSVQYTEKSLPTGNITDPLSLNYYTYSANNPVLYCDPSGNAWETVLDVVSLVESTATLIADPSIQNALFFTWDAASAVLPFIPGSYVTKLTKFGSKYDDFSDFTKILSKSKHAENGIEFITSVKKGTNIIELANSGKYLMGTYGDMKKYTSGYNHAVEAHHLLEQRIFKNVMQTNDMLSVVIPHDLHKELTSLWKNVVPYNSDYTALLNNPIEFKKIINEVYKDYPEILDLALDYFDSLNLGDIK